MEVSVPHARPAWIPKKVTAQHINQDGIKCWTVLIALTGGAIDEDNNGVEVEVTHDGNVLTVSETCSPDVLDVAGLCASVTINSDGMSIEETMRRRFAMRDAVREMIDIGETNSVFQCRTPFRVDPTEKRVQFIGFEDGSRFVHIDLTEKKRIKKQRVARKPSKPDTVCSKSGP